MGSIFSKSEPKPVVYYMYTMDVKRIIANVNSSHPYVDGFLESYPYSVNYSNAGSTFQWLWDYESTNYTFRSHVYYAWHERCRLSMTKRQRTTLTAIANFTFATLPVIRTSMTVGDLRDICNIANRAALAHIFKHSPDASSWACVPIPTIDMHIEMTTVTDRTRITLSSRQAKKLAAFLKQPFVEDAEESKTVSDGIDK